MSVERPHNLEPGIASGDGPAKPHLLTADAPGSKTNLSRFNLEPGIALRGGPANPGLIAADAPGSRPTLLDLFCGAGGAAEGYKRAGFDVVGVDLAEQPNYPFEFYREDALRYLRDWLEHPWRQFDAVHASPPCQARSDLQKQSKIHYEEFVPRVRHLLRATGLPYVIENVEGPTEDPEAQLIDPIVLCGTMFPGLRVIRHRLFESNFPLTAPAHPKHPLVFTHDKRKNHHGKLDQDTSFVQVTGGGNCTVRNKLDAMGVYWMTGAEANEAIPPAYTYWVGGQLLNYVQEQEAIAA